MDPQFSSLCGDLLRCSRSYNTWKANRGISRKIESLESKFNIDLSPPWCTGKLGNFILALANEKLASSTVRTYLARAKSLHQQLQLPFPETRGWVSQLLQGLGNSEDNLRMKRLAVTPEVMLLLKWELARSGWSLEKKRLVWLVCTWLFNGSLRPGELLCPSTSKFIHDQTLNMKDVSLNKVSLDGVELELLVLRIKNPKEIRGQGVVMVEMPAYEGFSCPVTAWRKYAKEAGRSVVEDRPVSTLAGRGYTNLQFNADLKLLLSSRFDYVKEGILAHSFRAGMTSALAKIGVSDTVLQRQGRWKSAAFLSYCKQGRYNNVRTVVELNKKVVAQAGNKVVDMVLVNDVE